MIITNHTMAFKHSFIKCLPSHSWLSRLSRNSGWPPLISVYLSKNEKLLLHLNFCQDS
jgi:hypothetical protein